MRIPRLGGPRMRKIVKWLNLELYVMFWQEKITSNYTSGAKIDFRHEQRLPACAYCAPKTQKAPNFVKKLIKIDCLFFIFSWLLSKHPMFVRTSQDVYLEKATQFIGKVVEQVKDLQFYTVAGEKGGPIIMTQVIIWFSSFFCDILCKISRQLLISKVHVDCR